MTEGDVLKEWYEGDEELGEQSTKLRRYFVITANNRWWAFVISHRGDTSPHVRVCLAHSELSSTASFTHHQYICLKCVYIMS